MSQTPSTDLPVDLPGPPSDPATIDRLRQRIDALDGELIRLWRERAAVSRAVGAARLAAGGTRLVLARENEIVDRYREELGQDGVPLALLVLRAGRGALIADPAAGTADPAGGIAGPG